MRNAVLVVEDDECNLNFLVSALNRNGWEAIPAADAAVALRIASDPSIHIELAVLDIRIPKGSGFVLAQQILQQRPKARFLLVSGSPVTTWNISEVESLRAIGQNRFCFLPKPFTVQSLRECINCLLAEFDLYPRCCKHGLDQLTR